jgi:hypothetical protein
MKTLADVRRRLVVGTEVEIVNHVRPVASGPRKALKVQTNSICWASESHPQGTWLDWPKATYVKVTGPDEVVFLCGEKHCPENPTKPFLTIKFK